MCWRVCTSNYDHSVGNWNNIVLKDALYVKASQRFLNQEAGIRDCTVHMGSEAGVPCLILEAAEISHVHTHAICQCTRLHGIVHESRDRVSIIHPAFVGLPHGIMFLNM